MPIAGPDKHSSVDPKKPAPEDLDPPAEDDDEESKDPTAQPDKKEWM